MFPGNLGTWSITKWGASPAFFILGICRKRGLPHGSSFPLSNTGRGDTWNEGPGHCESGRINLSDDQGVV